MINEIQTVCDDMSMEFYDLSDKRISPIQTRESSLKKQGG
jgi:hypothetical protein